MSYPTDSTGRPLPQEPTPGYNAVWAHYLANQRKEKIKAQFLTILHHSYSDQEYTTLANIVDHGMLPQ